MGTRKLEPVWKALADPTRRRILDELRSGPRTTSELCKLFDLSRFAVMKHLGVLERAGLVLVRRRGRERHNHLNAVPIQEIYERWVRPFAAEWARGMVRLKSHLEARKVPIMANPMKTKTTFGVANVELAIDIAAAPRRVWKALFAEISDWWLKDFYAGPATAFVFEAKLGGRLYEDWGDGNGLVWYTVTGIERNRSVLLQGWLTSAFGGPATTLLEIKLHAKGKSTHLELSDTVFGNVGESKRAQTEAGWRMLLVDGLKRHVEAA